MLALYRDGQQAGALAAYRAARAVLVGELGAEPGPELRRLQQQILAADTALDALSPAAAGGSGPGPAAAVPGQRSGPVVPRQLPAAAAHSAGRAAELKVLDESAGAGGNVAHRRFASAVAAHLFAASPSPTFEQFTERAGRVVAAASQAAAVTGQETVTTVDLLLGLFSEPDGVAGRVLAAMNVSEQSVRAAIRAAHSGAADDGTADSCNALVASGGAGPAGAEDGTAESRPAFDHDARHALQKALATALQLGHSYIGTEQILLGLYWDEENRNVAAKVLVQAGAPETVARAHISEMLRGFTTSS
jgi:hypothetical protein